MSIIRCEKSDIRCSPENTYNICVHSSHLKGRGDISVYNSSSSKQQLGVILLLHGVYGSHWSWMYSGGVHFVYERLKRSGLGDFALVMPSDGGLLNGSAYLPTKKHGNYEKWIVEDVMEAAKMHIEGVDENSNCYVAGLSMGGYGALRLGSKYPAMFQALSGLSSITDINQMDIFVEENLKNYACESDNDPSLIHWMSENKNELPEFRFDCGRADPLIEANTAFHKTLKSLGINHHFEVFDGGHDWCYWSVNIARTLWYFNDIENAFK